MFLLMAWGSDSKSSEKKVKLEDSAAITDFFQGKWKWIKYASLPNENHKFRFEISGNQLKIWSCIGNTNDPFNMSISGQPHIHQFTLGPVTRDVDGQPCRYLEFDEGNVSLAYRCVSPIWITAYDDEPTIWCAGGTSWNRGWD